MRPNQVIRVLEGFDYPVTSPQLLDEIGDIDVELAMGSESVGAVFDRIDIERFDSAMEARDTFLAGLSSKAIGRKGYSDRDPPSGLPVDPVEAFETTEAEPNCTLCRHMTREGDWVMVAYCELKDEIIEPLPREVCEDFAMNP